MKDKKEPWACPICGKPVCVVSGAGVCKECEAEGVWMDPAGGVHFSNNDPDYDPAKMYE